jgi:hypothetical protein
MCGLPETGACSSEEGVRSHLLRHRAIVRAEIVVPCRRATSTSLSPGRRDSQCTRMSCFCCAVNCFIGGGEGSDEMECRTANGRLCALKINSLTANHCSATTKNQVERLSACMERMEQRAHNAVIGVRSLPSLLTHHRLKLQDITLRVHCTCCMYGQGTRAQP